MPEKCAQPDSEATRSKSSALRLSGSQSYRLQPEPVLVDISTRLVTRSETVYSLYLVKTLGLRQRPRCHPGPRAHWRQGNRKGRFYTKNIPPSHPERSEGPLRVVKRALEQRFFATLRMTKKERGRCFSTFYCFLMTKWGFLRKS